MNGLPAHQTRRAFLRLVTAAGGLSLLAAACSPRAPAAIAPTTAATKIPLPTFAAFQVPTPDVPAVRTDSSISNAIMFGKGKLLASIGGPTFKDADDLVKDWRAQAGDQIRSEFERALGG